MRDFLKEVLEGYGAELSEAEGVLSATLPEEGEGGELAKSLGGRTQHYVFEAGHRRLDAELVAPGSHALRAIEGFLATRGLRTYVIQPAEGKLLKKNLGLRPAKGLDFGLEGRRQDAGYAFHVVYRLRYRSLTRVDVLEAVRVRLLPGVPPEVSRTTPPAEAAEWEVKARKQAPSELLQLALQLADEAVGERAQEEGQRRREEARKRFTKDASRLHAYYAGQIAEYERKRRSELTPIRIEELEEERELRLRELAASSEVTVEIEPLQLLTVEIPVQRAELVIKTKGESSEDAPRAPLVYDRAEQVLHAPPCGACQGDLLEGQVSGCAGGHVIHLRCLDRCGSCEGTLCAACGTGACAVCANPLCPSCGSTCGGCKRVACAEHLTVCALCERGGCPACLRACNSCGSMACADDLVDEELCRRCAVTCPGCQRGVVKATLTGCQTCGRKFCTACLSEADAPCVLCVG